MRLIERLLQEGAFTQDSLAQELVVHPRAFAQYRAGEIPMPLDRQLCLALVLIERVPEAARTGYQLRAQVLAAMCYEARTTSTHAAALLQAHIFPVADSIRKTD